MMRATGVSFLTFLPPSVTHFCLQGVPNFWKVPDNFNDNGIPGLQIIWLLSWFPDMTKLDLTGFTDGTGPVTNLVLQTIIKTMTKLQALKFSHGSCTDFGLSGIENGQVVGVSLTELKGNE